MSIYFNERKKFGMYLGVINAWAFESARDFRRAEE